MAEIKSGGCARKLADAVRASDRNVMVKVCLSAVTNPVRSQRTWA